MEIGGDGKAQARGHDGGRYGVAFYFVDSKAAEANISET
jgi:hypothetical protein